MPTGPGPGHILEDLLLVPVTTASASGTASGTL